MKYINEFDTLGFRVNGLTNEIKCYGNLSSTIAIEIWINIHSRLECPDDQIPF